MLAGKPAACGIILRIACGLARRNNIRRSLTHALPIIAPALV
ncbi:hypothetical protein [Palleniella muris]|nr:hypothetical protein [Palleniella muris]